MSRLAVSRAAAPVMMRTTALSLRGATGAAALARALLARYRLAGAWPADAELLVLTPLAPAPAQTDRARAPDRPQPLHIRLSADIRLLRRLLTERAAPAAARPEARTGRTEVPRPERRSPERAARSASGPPRRADRPARLGPTIIHLSTPGREERALAPTVIRQIRTLSGIETRTLLVIRSLASPAPSPGAPVMAVRAQDRVGAGTAGREMARRDQGEPRPQAAVTRRTGKANGAAPAGATTDVARPALPGQLAAEPARLEIVRREAASPDTPSAETALEHPRAVERPALRTRAAARARGLTADRTPKLIVRNRRGPAPSLDRRTLAGRAAPVAARITPIIPRVTGRPAVPGAPAALATPDRVVPTRAPPGAGGAVLKGLAPQPVVQPAAVQPMTARFAGAPDLAAARRALSAGPRGDQRQAAALDIRRAPAPAERPAAREAEAPSEARAQTARRAAETPSRPPQIDAPMLRKALNALPASDFEPLAERLIAEFEWRLRRGLERSGRL